MPSRRRQVLGIRRLVVGTLVLIWAGIIAVAIYYVSLEHKLIERTMVAGARQNGAAWADHCAEWMDGEQTSPLQNLVERIGGQRDVRQAWIVNLDGLVIAATIREQLGTHVQHAPDVGDHTEVRVEEGHPAPSGFFHEAGHNFDFFFPIAADGRRLGTLGIVMNTAWGNREAKTLATKALATLLLISIGFGVAAIWVDRKLVSGVRRLTGAIDGIASGQLDQQVKLGTGDELDSLGDSVTRMSDALQQSEQRVKHWQRRLEGLVAQRTQQLEESQTLLAQNEKMAALGLMAAGVAHEVGNPLASISAIVQRLEWDAEPRLRDKCRIIREQIERISKTIDELRQFARPGRTGENTPVDVGEVLKLTLQVCHYDPRGKRVKIDTQLDADLPSIRGEPDRWQQVFLNLTFNAFDAMPDGGRLTITGQLRGDHVELLFRDTGEGMSPEQLQKLFHPFYSTKQAGQGSGLGLSVCQGIVQSCGGEITAKSAPGQGAEFRITAPVYQHQEPETGDSAAPSSAAPASARDSSH
ncbi:MAG: HAMP domain-containing protein [Planctomycetes bacterium]|nr:HAMP domain-containing protein [Planctomycetota bacterium]